MKCHAAMNDKFYLGKCVANRTVPVLKSSRSEKNSVPNHYYQVMATTQTG